MGKKKVSIAMVSILAFFSLLIVGCTQSNSTEPTPPSNEGEQKGNREAGETVELVLSHTAAEGTPIYTTYEKFKQLVEEKSQGSITIKIHPHGQLADDTTGVEMVQSGSLDIASAGTNNMAPFTNLFLVFDLPYIFKDVESAHKVLAGEIGEEIKQKFEEELNLKLLFFLDPGSQRDLMNTERVVRVPDDVKGLKFRSAQSPIEIATIEALGGVATPIAWAEVYSALEQGVVNAQLQQYHWAVTANHQEIIRYVTETGGIHAFHLAIMSGDRFNALSEEQQQIILEAAALAQAFNFEESPKLVDALRQKMIDAGVEIYQPTQDEKEVWMERAQTVWDQFADQIPEGLIERIVTAQN